MPCYVTPSGVLFGAALRQLFGIELEPLDGVQKLVEILRRQLDFDIVAGYRSPRNAPWPRGLLAWSWGVLIRLLFGLRVRDIDCAFKLFRREVLLSIPIASLGAFVNTEILVRARAAGWRIHQIPVTHRRRRSGRQTGAHPRVLLRAAVELAKDWRSDRVLRRLEATLVVADKDTSLLVSGAGDVIEPDDGILAIGSGGSYALAAARALMARTELGAEEIASESMKIAADICVFTNGSLTVEKLP